MRDRNNLKEERFILAHDVRGSSPQSLGSVLLGPWSGRTSWWQEHGAEAAYLMAARKQRQAGSGQEPPPLTPSPTS
jgi:hypothetical protein